MLKIVSATAMTIFSLASVFAATMAWFSFNIDTNSDGMNLNIGDIGGRLKKVHFHSLSAYTPEIKDGNGNVTTQAYFKFVKNPFITYKYNWGEGKLETEDTPKKEWAMGEYYYDDREHPMLIIFEFDKDYVSTDVGDIYIQGITTVGGEIQNAYAESDTEHTNPLYTINGGFLGARDDDGVPLYSLPQTQVNDATHPDSILMRNNIPGVDEMGNPTTFDYYALSSVVDFQYRTFDSSSYETFSNSNNTLNFAFNTLSESESFTTINTSTDKYLFNQKPYFYKSDGHSTVKYVALVMNYSPEAIGYIYSTYLGDSGLDSYWGVLRFDCDWRFEVA